MAGQADKETELKGERCPGEEVCRVGGPLAKYPNDPAETVCNGCRLRDTKPGNVPRELAGWLTFALDCDAAKEMGAAFQYPDAFAPMEWAALRALYQGRGEARQRDQIRQAREAERQAAQQRLEAKLGRR